MKTKILSAAISLIAALTLSCSVALIISIVFTSCTKKTCSTGYCLGTDNKCYGPCTGGAYCTSSKSGNCSAPSAGGVYCCTASSGGGSGGGCGSQMGCCPTTGCGTGWLGSSTNLCYATSNDCHTAGNNTCRQCY